MKRSVEIAAAAAALSLIAWSAVMPAFLLHQGRPVLPKRGGVSAFAGGWATAKEGEARARARRAAAGFSGRGKAGPEPRGRSGIVPID